MKRILSLMLLMTFLSALVIPARAAGESLLGAGSTFAYPLYSKMFEVYGRQHGVEVNYQAIGSGGGQRQLFNKIVDFGASDVFLTDSQLKTLHEKVLHIPTCLGAVSLTYNLPGNPVLRFTPGLIADIFLGKINNWNDPRIKKVNPGVNLPDLSMATVHRSDGSGTTGIFTSYLAKISPEWKKKVGEGLAVSWPNGLGAKGSPGVAGLIQRIPGSIGYVELIYALENHLPQGVVADKHGKFIKPTLESTSLSGNVRLPADTRILVTNSSAAGAYPISGFTWILVYKEQDYGGRSKQKAEALARLLWWMVHAGQAYTKPMSYAPLPLKAVRLDERILKSMTYEGKPILEMKD